MPQARFFCRTGELAGTEYRIGDEATIGRGAENAVVLPAGVVSQRHARIVFDPDAGAYVLEDLRSRNGTRLDGARIADRIRLGRLHVVTLGEEHDFVFVVPSDARTGEAAAADHPGTAFEPAPALRVPPLAAAPGGAPGTAYGPPSALRAPALTDAPAPEAEGGAAPSPPTELDAPSVVSPPSLAGDPPAGGPDDDSPPEEPLPGPAPAPRPRAGDEPGVTVVLTLPGGGRRRIALPDGRHVVGRASDCAVWIDDRTLSRQHAALAVRGGAVTVEDLRSRNGTFLAGRPVGVPTPVPTGQPVTFGKWITAVVAADSDETGELGEP